MKIPLLKQIKDDWSGALMSLNWSVDQRGVAFQRKHGCGTFCSELINNVLCCSWTWSCRWSTCPSALTLTPRASCSSSAWLSLGTCCSCTERRPKWSFWRARSSRSSVSAAQNQQFNRRVEGASDLNHLFSNCRHRLLHASQRRDGDSEDEPQRSRGYVRQPAEEGDGSGR